LLNWIAVVGDAGGVEPTAVHVTEGASAVQTTSEPRDVS
jgi:hypothetical protein